MHRGGAFSVMDSENDTPCNSSETSIPGNFGTARTNCTLSRSTESTYCHPTSSREIPSFNYLLYKSGTQDNNPFSQGATAPQTERMAVPEQSLASLWTSILRSPEFSHPTVSSPTEYLSSLFSNPVLQSLMSAYPSTVALGMSLLLLTASNQLMSSNYLPPPPATTVTSQPYVLPHSQQTVFRESTSQPPFVPALADTSPDLIPVNAKSKEPVNNVSSLPRLIGGSVHETTSSSSNLNTVLQSNGAVLNRDGCLRPFKVCRRCLPSDGAELDNQTRVKRYQCYFPGCCKAYYKRSHLNEHIHLHTGMKPYSCAQPGCDARFTRADQLSRHRRAHTGERNFFCLICYKRFKRSDHLKVHLSRNVCRKS